MPAMDFLAQVEKLREEHKAGTNQLMVGEDFTIDVRLANGVHTPRKHTCSRDEFTYVLSGEVEMWVEGESTLLTAGQGFLVEAGRLHNTYPKPGASWLLVAKGHEHVYFE